MFSEDTVQDTLLVLSQLTDWNAIDLFTTESPVFIIYYRDKFLPLPLYRLNAFRCLNAIAQKGMGETPHLKLQIITETLKFPEILETLVLQYSQIDWANQQFSSSQLEDHLVFYSTVAESLGWLLRWCFDEDAKE